MGMAAVGGGCEIGIAFFCRMRLDFDTLEEV